MAFWDKWRKDAKTSEETELRDAVHEDETLEEGLAAEPAAAETDAPEQAAESAEPEAPANVQAILEWINGDLSERYPAASDAASMEPDRGALRALVWSEKVTRLLQSLLARYVTQGDRMLENTGVFVCTICGFVYIGDTPPELCPVCKVPGWRFEKAERRAS